MASRLSNLKLNEVSLVDSPANKHARVALFKRDARPAHEDGNYPSSLLKREFSDKERKAAAGSGAAMPGGGYPIEDEADLKNAIRAIGRAKDPGKTKAHIRSRAKALGLTDMLPDTWGKRDSGAAVLKFFVSQDKDFAKIAKGYGDGDACTFDDAQASAEESEALCDLMQEVNEAVCALGQSVWSIQADDTVSDKGAAVQQSLDQFGEHVKTIVPEGVENALVAQALAEAGYTINPQGAIQLAKGADSMTLKLIAKQYGLPETATEADILKAIEKAAKDKEDKDKADAEKAKMMADATRKMCAKHRAFVAHPDAALPDGGAEAFVKMSHADRDAHIAKHKLDGDEDPTDIEKSISAGDAFRSVDGTVITKRDAGSMFSFLKSQNDRLAKAEKDAEESKDKAAAKEKTEKCAGFVAIGKADEMGGLLFQIAKHDPKLADKVEALLKHASELVAKGEVFKEFGRSPQNVEGSATDVINKGAAELLKAEPALKSIEKARTEFRKRNPELLKREQDEGKVARRAA